MTDVNVDIGPNLTSLLERLAQQLGVTVDTIFPWYVNQAANEGVVFITFLVPMFLLSAIFFQWFLRKAFFERNHEEFYGCLSVITGFLTFISFLACIFEVPDAILKIQNPQYYAVQKLTQDVGNLTKE